MKKQSLIAALLVMCATSSMSLAQQGMVHLSIPGDIPALPYYARIAGEASGGTEVYHDGTWAAIVFYCNPAYIPPDFNLLAFFAAEPVTNTTVSGYMMMDPKATDGVPKVISLHGDGAVPVWFVRLPELLAAMADEVLTQPELEGLTSLVQGTATVFNEELLPLRHITINAQGTFPDGKRFQFHAVGTAAGLQVVKIRL